MHSPEWSTALSNGQLSVQEFDVQCMTAGKDRIVAMQKVMHALDARYLADETLPLQVRPWILNSAHCNDS